MLILFETKDLIGHVFQLKVTRHKYFFLSFGFLSLFSLRIFEDKTAWQTWHHLRIIVYVVDPNWLSLSVHPPFDRCSFWRQQRKERRHKDVCWPNWLGWNAPDQTSQVQARRKDCDAAGMSSCKSRCEEEPEGLRIKEYTRFISIDPNWLDQRLYISSYQ